MTDSPCVFCKIVAGESQASIIYRDQQVTAFLDTSPINRGHTLLIPNQHTDRMAHTNPAVGGYLFGVAMSLSEAVRESVKAEGVNLIVSDGKTAGQTLFHVHVHIIPRHEDDGFGFQFPTGYPSQPERERLDKDARAIRRLLRKVKVR